MTMSCLLPCLDDDNIQSFIDINATMAELGGTAAIDVHTEPSEKSAFLPLLPPPPPYDATHRGVDIYLDVSEVEQYLETMEQHDRADPDQDRPDFEQGPNSPYFGRTTPMMFTEQQMPGGAGFSWGGDVCAYGNSQAFTGFATNEGPSELAIQIPQVETDVKACIVPDFQQLGENIVSPGNIWTPIIANDVATTSTLDEPVPLIEEPPMTPGPITSRRSTLDDTVPGIKQELRLKIQARRRESGLEEAVPEYKQPGPEILTDKDLERRLRRRASNRRAATKSRIKKKHAEQKAAESKASMEHDNVSLHDELQELRSELNSLKATVQEHLGYCQNPGHLADVLREVDK